MSYFAKVEDNGLVVEVFRGDSSLNDEQAHQWFVDTFGGTWIQTSYTGAIRYNFAGIGYAYDSVADAFIAPKPYPSWLLDTSTYQWVAPVPYPNDGHLYEWDEATLSWVLA